MSHRKRLNGRNYHHLFPRSRSKNPISQHANLLLIDTDRHVHWHQVFGNLTLREVIVLLHRVFHAKGYTEVEECPICRTK